MTQGAVAVFSYAAGTPLLLGRAPVRQETNARRAVALAFLAIQKHQLGVPEYESGRCANHAAKVGDAVMGQFWDGFVRASQGILVLRQKLVAACGAASWYDFMAAEQATANAPKAKVASYITDEMLDRALDTANAKLASLPALPARVEPPAVGTQGELFDRLG